MTTGQQWCTTACSSYSTLLGHMPQPSCNTKGSSFAAYLTQLGVDLRHFFTCDGCGDTAQKQPTGTSAPAARTALSRGGESTEGEHQTRATLRRTRNGGGSSGWGRRHGQREVALRRREAAAPAGLAHHTQPLEVVRLFTAEYTVQTGYDAIIQELWLILEFFAGDEAQLAPKADHNVDAAGAGVREVVGRCCKRRRRWPAGSARTGEEDATVEGVPWRFTNMAERR